MPIKKIDSGIFSRKVIKGFGKAEEREYQRIRENATLEKLLRDIEQRARAILRKHGINKWPNDMPFGEKSVFATGANEELNNADALLTNLHYLYKNLQSKDCDAIARYALAVGRLETMLDVRPHEKPAVTGRKSRAKMAQWREARSKKVASKHARIMKLFDEIKNQYEAHERPSDREILKTIGKHLGLKFRTVESVFYRTKNKSTK